MVLAAFIIALIIVPVTAGIISLINIVAMSKLRGKHAREIYNTAILTLVWAVLCALITLACLLNRDAMGTFAFAAAALASIFPTYAQIKEKRILYG